VQQTHENLFIPSELIQLNDGSYAINLQKEGVSIFVNILLRICFVIFESIKGKNMIYLLQYISICIY